MEGGASALSSREYPAGTTSTTLTINEASMAMTTDGTILIPSSLTPIWMLGDRMRRFGRLADGVSFLSECQVPPGSGVPVHAHPSPETFIIRSGELTITLGDGQGLRDVACRPGDVITMPSMGWHAYRNRGAAPVEMYCLYDRTLEAFFDELASTEPPAGPPTPQLMKAVIACALRHGMQIRS